MSTVRLDLDNAIDNSGSICIIIKLAALCITALVVGCVSLLQTSTGNCRNKCHGISSAGVIYVSAIFTNFTCVVMISKILVLTTAIGTLVSVTFSTLCFKGSGESMTKCCAVFYVTSRTYGLVFTSSGAALVLFLIQFFTTKVVTFVPVIFCIMLKCAGLVVIFIDLAVFLFTNRALCLCYASSLAIVLSLGIFKNYAAVFTSTYLPVRYFIGGIGISRCVTELRIGYIAKLC